MKASVALVLGVLVVVLCAACGSGASPKSPPTPALPTVAPNELRPPSAFDVIADRTERSRALFMEATRVMLHPRCVNCHPYDDSPRQGDAHTMHDPPVFRGEKDEGVVGLECSSCHQTSNAILARIPGAPKWHLAPKIMAWLGRSPAALCDQLKDPKRNGGRSLAEIAHHAAHDELVGWGWKPGADRTPAPGTQEQFGALVAAWIDTGAECPR